MTSGDCASVAQRFYNYATFGNVCTAPKMRRLEDTKTVHWWENDSTKTVFYVWIFVYAYAHIQKCEISIS